MKLHDLLKENADKKVNVSYPDGKGDHTTYVKDLGDRFSCEGLAWRTHFFTELLTKGEAFTNIGGHYQLA